MEVTQGLAELFGIYVGDGTMSVKRTKSWKGMLMSIAASREEKGWLEHVADLFEQIFCYRPRVRWNFNVYKIQTGISRICKFFAEAGFPVGEKALTVRAPNAIMDVNSEDAYKTFLRGYFDADGCLNFERRQYGKYGEFKKTRHYYPRIFLVSISRDLILTDIQQMLESMDLRYRIYEKEPSAKGKCRVYTVVLKGPTQLDMWMKEIGSSNPVHLTKYQVWQRFGFCPPRTTLGQRLAILLGKLDPKTFYGD